MRNFYASNGASCIPYRKEYRKHFIPFPPIDGGKVKELTMGGAIVFQQLEYWSAKKPKGFYKFLAKPGNKHPKYNDGDSWVEELGCSEKEFRTCFDQFGASYKSKKEFSEQPEPFQGRFYCSYVDRINHVTWYFRNHELVDQFLDKVVASSVDDSPQEDYELPDVTPNCPPGVCGSAHQEFAEVPTGQMGKLPVVSSATADQEVRYLYTETTSQTTSETTTGEEDDFTQTPSGEAKPDKKRKDIASQNKTRKTKPKPPVLTEEQVQAFIDLYHQEKPVKWKPVIAPKDITPALTRNLGLLVQEYGEDSMDKLRKALIVARTHKFWSDCEMKLEWVYRKPHHNINNPNKIEIILDTVSDADLARLDSPIATHIQTPQDDKRARILERTARVAFNQPQGVVA